MTIETNRRYLSRLARVRIFDRHRGICAICGLKIHAERGEKWEADHVKSLWLGGRDDEFNLAPVHAEPCHRDKSADENTDRSKSNRLRQNFLGIPKFVKQPMRFGRNSDLTKKLNGEIVKRLSQSERHRAMMARRNGVNI
jgi:hypothetical protein